MCLQLYVYNCMFTTLCLRLYCMFTAVCLRLYVYGCVFTIVCSQLHVYDCMFTIVCLRSHVYNCMFTTVCLRLYVYDCMCTISGQVVVNLFLLHCCCHCRCCCNVMCWPAPGVRFAPQSAYIKARVRNIQERGPGKVWSPLPVA